MGSVSVAQAAQRLGVSVSRIHQRIADGSLAADRIGAQWVVDEWSLLQVQERSRAGRPYSARSAWSLIAMEPNRRDCPGGSVDSSRVRKQWERLLEPAVEPLDSEEAVSELAASLRSVLRNRAQRRLFRAASGDLEDLSADPRWAFLVDGGASGIASANVEGYLEASQVEGIAKDYLLVESERDANVVLHVIPDGQPSFPNSRLRLAADLAEYRAPREEARAAQLAHELAVEWKESER